MIVLNNPKGKVHFTDTQPVAITFNFLKALFDMESNFHRKEETFKMNKESRPRQLNHLTHADLAVATVLFVVCNTQGRIWNVTPHMIYQKLVELYESPISSSQFYESIEKLKLHGLIQVEEAEGLYNYQLNHFWDVEKGKIHRYVIFHPVVFCAAFNGLPLSHKKLFYAAVAQQREKGYTVYHSLTNDGEDFRGLYALTHKNQRHQVDKIFADLTSLPIMEEKPLFTLGKLERKGKKSYVAMYSLNPYYLLKAVKGKKYHEPLAARKVYPRLFGWVQKELLDRKAGEILAYNKGQYAYLLIRSFRKLSRSVILYLLDQLVQFFRSYKSLPRDLAGFIREKRISKTEASILQITEQTGILPLITIHTPNHERTTRLQEFISNISHLPLKTIKEVCQRGYKALKASTHSFTYPIEAYVVEDSLNHWEEYALIRTKAHREQRDPTAFGRMEKWVFTQLQLSYYRKEEILEFALEQLEKLTFANHVPAVPESFKIEDFLMT